MSLEKTLVEQCAPTLASIKTASLFPIKCTNINLLHSQISHWNHLFADKRIRLCVLKVQNDNALIYVYREDALKRDLHNKTAQFILEQSGYQNPSLSCAISTLKKRFNQNQDFPHEIGLFLGYPPSDVLGFINHKGKNSHLCGYWKVYESPEKAKKTFDLFDKCKEVYRRLWAEGTDIMQLTVA